MLAHAMPVMPRQVEGKTVESLLEILRDDVNLAVWQRQVDPVVSQFGQTLLVSGRVLAETCTWTAKDAEHSDIAKLPRFAQGVADIPGYAEFVADVGYLVSLFACLLDARAVGVRLRTLDKAMCPRWHVDKVAVRLITSYVGPGSEWLTEQDSPRQQLGGPAADSCNDDVAARAFACGEVALLKGERWHGNEGRGLVHRSPRLPLGQRRLLLTLDWLD
ncbi:DUF1826 domain-containing protein [Halopseudomonas pelagia]|uniref:DUF1826 domain-containing protein n=1 Tax=Halopseudomonas pelagia TaxID=553151 RepID=A0AA91Z4D2_9GAMM|nr:DUF1826 domain-containing protein [Halopseudomonas pelagia]PCC97534.1 hypothetical protein CO192_19925 [Halopseudomonas pelagia]QFY57849.1 DUF1826 domain-containing protein [Halopseudomonas pelagia]